MQPLGLSPDSPPTRTPSAEKSSLSSGFSEQRQPGRRACLAKRKTKQTEGGLAAVEFAIGALLLLLLGFGAMEFGFYLQKGQTVASAVRTATRIASTGCIETTSASSCVAGNRESDDFETLRSIQGSMGKEWGAVESILIYKIPSNLVGKSNGKPPAWCRNADDSVKAEDNWCNLYDQNTKFPYDFGTGLKDWKLLENLDKFYYTEAEATQKTQANNAAAQLANKQNPPPVQPGAPKEDVIKAVFNCDAPTANFKSPSQPFCPTGKDSLSEPLRKRGLAVSSYLGVYVKAKHPFITGLFGQDHKVEQWSLFRLEPSPYDTTKYKCENGQCDAPPAGQTGKADLEVTKTVDKTQVGPNEKLTYTIKVKNLGPDVATNVRVYDPLPAQLVGNGSDPEFAPKWTCVPPSGSSSKCGGALKDGTGTISDYTSHGDSFPREDNKIYKGDTLTFTYETYVASDATSPTGTIINQASAEPLNQAGGLISSQNVETTLLQPNVTVTAVGAGTDATDLGWVDPGEEMNYTIKVANVGLVSVSNATISVKDLANQAGITDQGTITGWTCGNLTDPPCADPTTGTSQTIAALDSGQVKVFHVKVKLSDTAKGIIQPKATISLRPGVVNQAPVTTLQAAPTKVWSPNLIIEKTDGLDTVNPGQTVIYTITASNMGSLAQNNVRIYDPLPNSDLELLSWTCSATAGNTCPAGSVSPAQRTDNLDVVIPTMAGNGNITNPAITDSKLTFQLKVKVLPTTTSEEINNSAFIEGGSIPELTLSDNEGKDNPPDRIAKADVQLTKVNNVTEVSPGGDVDYTITVTNTHPTAKSLGVTLTDTFPTSSLGALTQTQWWCQSGCPGAPTTPVSASNINQTFTMDPNEVRVYHVTGKVAALPTMPTTGANADFYPRTTATDPGTLVNTATVTALGDPDPTNNTATSLTKVRANVKVYFDESATFNIPAGGGNPARGEYSAGQTVRYRLVYENDGYGDAANVQFKFPIDASDAAAFPTDFATLTCVSEKHVLGSVTTTPPCAFAGGAAPLNLGSRTILKGEKIIFDLDAVLAGAASGTVTTKASVKYPTWDPISTDDTAQIKIKVKKPDLWAQLSATTGNTPATDIGNDQNVGYVFEVSNVGSGDAPANVRAKLTQPASIAGTWSWTCVMTGTSTSCPHASGTGSINEVFTDPFIVGMKATYTITNAKIQKNAASGPFETKGEVISGVTEAGNPDPEKPNLISVFLDIVNPDLSVVKTRTAPSRTPNKVYPGDTVTYKLTFANAGPGPVNGAVIKDTVPADIANASWSCAVLSGTVTCPALPAVGTSLNATVNFPKGSSLQLTMTGKLKADANGQLVNTATIETPTGMPDRTSANDTSTVTDTIEISDLSVTKTNATTGTAAVTTGQTITYTIVATNNGAADVLGAKLVDNVPSALVGVSAADPTFQCMSALSTATCPAGETTAAAVPLTGINSTIDLPAGKQLTYQVVGKINSGITGTIIQKVDVNHPGTTVDPTPLNNNATVTNAIKVPDTSVTKTLATPASVPGAGLSTGTTLTYNAVVQNLDPTYAVTNASFIDTVPAELLNPTVLCTGTGCPAGYATATPIASSPLSITIPSLAASSSITFKISGTLSSAHVGPIVQKAEIRNPGGVADGCPSCSPPTNTSANNISTVSTPIAKNDLLITKVNLSPATAGATMAADQVVTYTLTVTNNGPGSVTGAVLNDPTPVTLTGVTYQCMSATSTATCASTAVTNATTGATPGINLTLPVIASNKKLVFTITGTVVGGVLPNVIEAATIALPGTASDSNTSNNSVSVSNPIQVSDLTVAKTDGTTNVAAGQQLTYRITVTNKGPGPINGAKVSDNPPAILTGAQYRCNQSLSSGATCPTGSTTYASVPAGGFTSAGMTLPSTAQLTWEVQATVSTAAASGATIAQTATVTQPGGIVDPTPADNTATDTDTVIVSDLSITKSNAPIAAGANVGSNQVIDYLVSVTNSGPGPITGAVLTDALPANASALSWSCSTLDSTETCPDTTVRNGAINATLPTIRSGFKLVYLVTVTVKDKASGNLVQTASVAQPGSAVDPTPSDNTVTVTNPIVVADLSITKTDGVTNVSAGQVLTYTVVASNAGPGPVNATITDTPPSQLTNVTWTCVSSTSGTCPANAASTLNVTTIIPSGGNIRYTATATVAALNSGTITQTAAVAHPTGYTDPTTSNNSITDTDTIIVNDLSVNKTDGRGNVGPGEALTYDIVLTNNGTGRIASASLTDTPPSVLTGVTYKCVGATGTAACPDTTTRSVAAGGTISVTGLVLPAGATITYQVYATVAITAPAGTFNQVVTVSQGVADPVPGNDSSTDTDTIVFPDAAVVKTATVASAGRGDSFSYRIVVTNTTGPGVVPSVRIQDTLPAAYLNAGYTWTCVATGTSYACPSASGTGDIDQTATNFPVGAILTYTVNVTVKNTVASGAFGNTATITPNIDRDTTNNTSTVNVTILNPVLTISKGNGVNSVVPGQAITYTIVATNSGPGTITNAVITDSVVSNFTATSWTCTAAGGVTCPAAGPVAGVPTSQTVGLFPVGATLTYVVTGSVPTTASGFLENGVSITPPTGVTGTASATDKDPIVLPNVSIAKADGVAIVARNQALTYNLVVSNPGPGVATNVQVKDTPPGTTLLTSPSFSCSGATGGAACPSTPATSPLNVTISSMPAGSTVTFKMTATVSSSAAANAVITNTADAVYPDADQTNNTSSDTDTVKLPDLSITKDDLIANTYPGYAGQYTIAVKNNGPGLSTGATVADTVPTGITSTGWSCTLVGGGSCTPSSGSGNISSTVNLPASAEATFKLNYTVNALFAGNYTNTATVTAASGEPDPVPGNNSASDTDTSYIPDVILTKTDGQTNVVPNQNLTYDVLVKNNGTSTASGIAVTDNPPSSLTGVAWTCVLPTLGAVCPTPPAGSALNQTIALPAGASVTFRMAAKVLGTAAANSNIANQATATYSGDPDTTNNSQTDTDTVKHPDLAITKTDGKATTFPGDTGTYTVAVTNNGPGDIAGATVTDTAPASLTSMSWTCSATAGSTCPASGTGAPSSVAVNLLNGGKATFLVAYTVTPTASADVVNSAAVAMPAGFTDPNTADNTASDTNTLNRPNISLMKDDGLTTVTPGQALTYTITVTNPGPGIAAGVVVTDTAPVGPSPAPLGLTGVSWSCGTATGGASCVAPSAGANLNATLGNMPAGSTVVYKMNATVLSSAAADSTIVNTATATFTGDPVTTNNSQTDTDTVKHPDLSITKDDGIVNTYPGYVGQYTIVAKNNGPGTSNGAVVNDPMPTGITSTGWTCSATAGSSCPASGTGAISNVAVNLVASGTATFKLNYTVNALFAGNYTNTATVAAPAGFSDTTPGNNSTSDTDTSVIPDVTLTKSDGQTNVTPGQALTYNVVVTNTGTSAANGISVTDTPPTSLVGAAWTCTGTSCPSVAAGSNLSSTLNLPAGTSVTYKMTATVSASAAADSTIANLATATYSGDPNTANNSQTDTDTVKHPDLGITITDGKSTTFPGDTGQYSVVVTNNGPGSITSAPVTVTLPAALTGVTWTCLPAGACPASGSGAPSSALVTLPALGTATFKVNYTVANTATGNVAATAAVAMPSGFTDPDTTNNTAGDTNTMTYPDVQVTKTDGRTDVGRSEALTYVIKVSNVGPGYAAGVAVTDTPPSSGVLTGISWTCDAALATGGAACPTVAAGANLSVTVGLPANSSLTFKMAATTSATAAGGTTIANTATVAFTNDPVTTNNSATDSNDTIVVPDITLLKNDGVLNVVPGDTLNYDVTVTNTGTVQATSVAVADTPPTTLTTVGTGLGWSCTPPAGSTCPTNTGTGGTLNATIPVLKPGEFFVFRLTAKVASSPIPAHDSTIKNYASATLAGDPTPTNNLDSSGTGANCPGCYDTDIVKHPDLAITSNADAVTTTWAGNTGTYTFVATNNGPGDSNGALVTNTITTPVNTNSITPALTGMSWTCVASAGSSCPASGTGTPSGVAVNLKSGGTATFKLDYTVANQMVGSVTSTASIAAPSGWTDPTATNNSVADTNTVADASVTITKTDGTLETYPGKPMTYTIVVSNSSTVVPVTNMTVTEKPQPGGFPGVFNAGAVWSCVASSGASCGSSTNAVRPSPNNDLQATGVNIPPGGSVTFTVNGTLAKTVTGTDLINRATYDISPTFKNPATNYAEDSDVIKRPIVNVTITDGVTTVVGGKLNHQYTIKATNTGPGQVTDLIVTDVLPTTGVLLNNPRMACDVASVITGGTSAKVSLLAAGAAVTCVVTVDVQNISVAGTATNGATAGNGIEQTGPVVQATNDVDTVTVAGSNTTTTTRVIGG